MVLQEILSTPALEGGKPRVHCSHRTVSKGWEKVSVAEEIAKQGVCGGKVCYGENAPRPAGGTEPL